MFKYNNTHIFTDYLKQLLASSNLPTCKIYTREFAEYLLQNGEEDPRVLESFDTISAERLAVRINYLKNNEVYNYLSTAPNIAVDFIDDKGNTHWKRDSSKCTWKRTSALYYNNEKVTRGLTRNLKNSSSNYDEVTHEYLGDYLRFLRDYYNVNLMSLYNCFNNKIYNNISFGFSVGNSTYTVFDSQDSNYRIYAVPVKLFSDYTIAIDCSHSIELFCGLYNTNLEISSKAEELAAKTYTKINKTLFKQPFLYDKLNVKNWPASYDYLIESEANKQIRTDIFTRWDLTNREQDLRLFIKVPVSCKSSITILEGDFRNYNDCKYVPVRYNSNGEIFDKAKDASDDKTKTIWEYSSNHSVLNFNTKRVSDDPATNTGDGLDLNDYHFKPISKLQLLAFNTGESYPFADRLVEYLSGSAITPLEEIPDNIKRAQRVMEQNKNYFQIEGIWENKMQNIIYDYMVNAGPIVLNNNEGGLLDKRQGYHKLLGHTSKSTLYDVLGYVDKDAEKWYASWKRKNDKVTIQDTIQNVDIYDGLYDI